MKTRTSAALGALALGALLSSGCAVVPHFGLFYSDAKHSVEYDPMHKDLFLAGTDYEVLGVVTGESEVENIAGVMATGDDSVTTAYRNAVAKAKGADALIDVHIDQHVFRIFTFYLKGTTIVTGTAIRMGGKSASASPGAAPASPGAASAAAGTESPASPTPAGEKKPEDDGWGK
jgi:hypothetical protein